MQCNNNTIIAKGGVQHLKKGVCSKSKPRTTWWLQKGDFLVGTKNTSHESWFTYLTLARDAHQLQNESSTQGRRGEDVMEFCNGCTPAAQWKSSTGRGWRSEAGSMVTLWGGEGRPRKTLDPKIQNQVRVCSKIAISLHCLEDSSLGSTESTKSWSHRNCSIQFKHSAFHPHETLFGKTRTPHWSYQYQQQHNQEMKPSKLLQ